MASKKQTKKNKAPKKEKVTRGHNLEVKENSKKVTLKDLDNELSELEPVVLDAGKRYKVLEYIEFVKWSALPSYNREPSTAEKFADKYKMNRKQLTRWKQSPEFWEDVSRVRRAYMKDDFPEIIAALKLNIIKNGRGQDVKVYAQLAGEMKEDGDGILNLSPDLEAAIAKIGRHLPD